MKHKATTRPGPRVVDGSPEGWQRLADRVRYEQRYEFQCETNRQFVAVTGISDRTLTRVLNAQGVSMGTLVKLDLTFEWRPGTALRTVQGSVSETPDLGDVNEETLWHALEGIAVLTSRDRLAFLHTFRAHREDSKASEAIV